MTTRFAYVAVFGVAMLFGILPSVAQPQKLKECPAGTVRKDIIENGKTIAQCVCPPGTVPGPDGLTCIPDPEIKIINTNPPQGPAATKRNRPTGIKTMQDCDRDFQEDTKACTTSTLRTCFNPKQAKLRLCYDCASNTEKEAAIKKRLKKCAEFY